MLLQYITNCIHPRPFVDSQVLDFLWKNVNALKVSRFVSRVLGILHFSFKMISVTSKVRCYGILKSNFASKRMPLLDIQHIQTNCLKISGSIPFDSSVTSDMDLGSFFKMLVGLYTYLWQKKAISENSTNMVVMLYKSVYFS